MTFCSIKNITLFGITTIIISLITIIFILTISINNTVEATDFCPIGQCRTSCGFTFGQDTCQPCPEGRRCPWIGIFDCGPGTSTKNPGKGNDECVDCKAGTYSDGQRNSECTKCAPGSYNDLTKSSFCQLCEAGTYNPNEGSKSMEDCIACPEGYLPIFGRSGAKSLEEACEITTTTTTTTTETSTTTTITSTSTSTSTTTSTITETSIPTTTATTTIEGTSSAITSSTSAAPTISASSPSSSPLSSTLPSSSGTTAASTAPSTTLFPDQPSPSPSSSSPTSSATVDPTSFSLPSVQSSTTTSVTSLPASSSTTTPQTTSSSSTTSPPTLSSTTTISTTTTIINNNNDNQNSSHQNSSSPEPSSSPPYSTQAPLSPQQVATKSVSSGGAIIASLSGNIPTAQHSFKTMALSLLSQCGQPSFILEMNPLGFDANPFGFEIPVTGDDDPLKTYRGALVANLIPFFSVLFASGFIVLFLINTKRPLTPKERDQLLREKQEAALDENEFTNNNNLQIDDTIELTVEEEMKPVSIDEAMRKARFPSLAYPVGIVLFGPPSLQAAAAVLIIDTDRYHRSGLDIALTFPALLFFLVLPVAIGIHAWIRGGSNKEQLVNLRERGESIFLNHKNKNNDPSEIEESLHRKKLEEETFFLDAETFEDEEGDRIEDDECCNPILTNSAVVRFFHYWLRPDAEWRRTDFILKHGLAIECFRPMWFFLFDYMIAASVAFLAGASMKCKSKQCCSAISVTSLVLTLSHAGSMFVVRPLVTRLDRFMNMILSVCPVIVCSLATYAVLASVTDSTIDEAIATVTLIELVLCVVDALLTFSPVVVDAYNWLRRVFFPSQRQQALKERRENRAKEAEQERMLKHQNHNNKKQQHQRNSSNNKKRKMLLHSDDDYDNEAAMMKTVTNLRDLHEKDFVDNHVTQIDIDDVLHNKTNNKSSRSNTNTNNNPNSGTITKSNSKNNSSSNSAVALNHYVDLVVAPTLSYDGHRDLPESPPPAPPRLSKNVLSQHLKLQKKWERHAIDGETQQKNSSETTTKKKKSSKQIKETSENHEKVKNDDDNNTKAQNTNQNDSLHQEQSTTTTTTTKRVRRRKKKSFFDLEPVASPEIVFGGKNNNDQQNINHQQNAVDLSTSASASADVRTPQPEEDDEMSMLLDLDEDELLALEELDNNNNQ